MSLTKLVDAYEAFVIHSKWYVPLLDAAKQFVFLMPNRYSETEIGGELTYTALGMLSYYHDGLLGRPRAYASEVRVGDAPPLIHMPEPRGVALLKSLLYAITATESLLDMASGMTFRHLHRAEYDRMAAVTHPTPGDVVARDALATGLHRFKWLVILAIEACKALVRLLLLARNGGRMLLPPSAADVAAEQQRRVAHAERRKLLAKAVLAKAVLAKAAAALAGNDTAASAAPAASPSSSPFPAAAGPPAAGDTAAVVGGAQANTHAPAASNSSSAAPSAALVSGDAAGEAAALQEPLLSLRLAYLSHGRGSLPHGQFSLLGAPRAHPAETAAQPAPLRGVVAEVVYWLRPVAYAAARLATGSESWVPLAVSGLFDLVSRLLQPTADLSPAQRAQLASRARLYLLYLMRDPLFSVATVRPLRAAADLLAPVPLLGAFLAMVVELATSLHHLHFYVSGS